MFQKRRDAIKAMQDTGYECPKITGWDRALPSDIDFVLDVDGITEAEMPLTNSISKPLIFASFP